MLVRMSVLFTCVLSQLAKGETPETRANAVVAVAIAMIEVADDRPSLPDQPPRSMQAVPTEPIRLEFTDARQANALPAQLVIGHWARGCPAGERQARDIRRILTPMGWSIGHNDTDQIQLVHISQDQSCPQIMLYQNGKIIKTWEGYQDPATLSRDLRTAWDGATPTLQPTGAAGAIHAKAQIRQLMDWWRQSLGEDTQVTCSWDRTGAQTFPLLAKGDWSTVAVFGKSGRVEIAANGSKLPVTSLGIGYRVIGDDVSIDVDPIVFKGLAQLSPKNNPAATTEAIQPAGIGPMTIWTIATVVRDLYLLLHPTCDLQLGGNVSATATLTGNTLTLDFQQAPSIKLVALFTFQLSVKRIEITQQSVRVLFNGSRLVSERTFEVK